VCLARSCTGFWRARHRSRRKWPSGSGSGLAINPLCGSVAPRSQTLPPWDSEATFARILADERFAGLPMLLETAKSKDAGRPDAVVLDPFDEKNLATLRRLRGA